MVPFVIVAGLVALVQVSPTQTVLVSRDTRLESRVDSIHALRSARRAQATFESIRRMNLPREYGVAYHRCDVRVGRWCVWNDESNDREPPPEPHEIQRARARLLAQLDTLGGAFPGNEWIAAQQVRYLLEAGRHADALHVAERCTASGSPYLCRALEGVVYHDSGAVAAADSAFTAALAAMPDSVRCRWTDISVLLDDHIGDRYHHASCAGRDSIATSFWRLTNPLWLRNHDWRNEFLARVTRAEMERDSRTPSGSVDDAAYLETALRYGFDTWFVRDEPPMGSMEDVSIAGFRGSGSGYNFIPDLAVFDAPDSLRESDWDLALHSAQTNYGPRYARHFLHLEHRQVALFRRADSALVVAAYEVGDDTLFVRGDLVAGLFAAPVHSTTVGEPRGDTTANASQRGVLMTRAPWSPMIVSVEVLDAKTRSAARARFGLIPSSVDSGISHSDLLLFAPPGPDSLPHRLQDAAALALSGDRVTGKRVGVFWEIYGVRKEGESFAVTITIERIREGLMRRAAERLHLASPFSPVQVQWKEVPDPVNGIVSRSVSLDVSQLSNGRYEIQVAVGRPDGASTVATRDIVIDR